MNASDIVIRIERSLLCSRMASNSMVWAGSMRSSSSHRRASPNALMKPSRAFVRMARRGRCASPTPWMISRRRREDTRVQGSVKTRSCPSQTMDSFRTISIRVALTVTQPIAFRTSFSLGRSLRMGLFMLRDGVVATSAAAVDVTAVDRVGPHREIGPVRW